MDNLTLLHPVTPSTLFNEFYIGFRPNSKVNFTLGTEFLIEGPHVHLYDYFNISVSVHELRLLVNLTADINVGLLYNVTMNTLFNHPWCALHALEHWGFPQFTVQLSKATVGIDCRRCTSPQLQIVKDRLDKMNDNFPAFVDFLNSGLTNSGVDGKGYLRRVPYWLEYEIYNKTQPIALAGCPVNISWDEMGPNQPPGMWVPLSYEYLPSSETSGYVDPDVAPYYEVKSI
jgi:hypothetical protein